MANAKPEPSNTDGEAAFEHSISLYPLDRQEYGNRAEFAYFEAIGEIRARRNVSDPEAIAILDGAIADYGTSKGEYAVRFSSFLEDRIYRSREKAVHSKAVQAIPDGVDLEFEREIQEMRQKEYALKPIIATITDSNLEEAMGIAKRRRLENAK